MTRYRNQKVVKRLRMTKSAKLINTAIVIVFTIQGGFFHLQSKFYENSEKRRKTYFFLFRRGKLFRGVSIFQHHQGRSRGGGVNFEFSMGVSTHIVIIFLEILLNF